MGDEALSGVTAALISLCSHERLLGSLTEKGCDCTAPFYSLRSPLSRGLWSPTCFMPGPDGYRWRGLSPPNMGRRPHPFSAIGVRLCAMLIYSEAEDPQPEPTPTPDPEPEPPSNPKA